MGNHETKVKRSQSSKQSQPSTLERKYEPPKGFVAIKDHYESIPQLQEALGISFTFSLS